MLKRLTKRTAPQVQKSTSLADLIALHGVGDPGPRVAPASFRSNVVAYRCIRMISEAAAAVPLAVEEHGALLADGPWCALLERPNPDEAGTDFFQEIYAYLQTHGNAYVEKLTASEDVRALFHIHPSTVEPFKEGYRLRTKRGERTIYADMSGRMPLLHLSLWQPVDHKAGLAPLQVAADAIHLHNAACAWNRQLIDNAARPSGALVHKGGEGGQNLTPEQFDRLKEELEAGFTGLRGAGRPLLLDGGLDWRPMGLTPAEMDFQNLKNSAARDIALAFGVPPMLLGIPGDNTYANYKEANLAFWRQTVLPLVGRVSQALAGWLDPGRSMRIVPDLAAVEALSPERSARLDRIADADFLTDAEKRAAFGYPPFDSTLNG
ncbi:MAG: phage portal protein [Pseudomonadota bacterium]